MKKLILSFGLLLVALGTFAQGLEGIIAEKYYVTNNLDSVQNAANNTNPLPAGTICWRLWVDLAPGYTLQAVYGVPGHNLVFTTTTTFFNDDNGTADGSMSFNNVRKNTGLIDSYLSVGGGASGKVGVFKSEDGDGSQGNCNGGPLCPGTPYLQNNDPSATGVINIGSATNLAAHDGLITGTPVGVTFVPGVANAAIFQSSVGGSLIDNNFSYAALGGASGPTAANRVLIGQFTTKGVFHFELNIQLGTPSLGSENWVASNPVGAEHTMAALTQTLNVPNGPPINVAITSPADLSNFTNPENFQVSGTANDSDGTVTKVVLKRDNVPYDSIVANPVISPFTFTNHITSSGVGSHTLVIVATDNQFAQTTSAIVHYTVGSNAPPTVTITAPANGAPYVAPAPVNITTNASDSDPGDQVDSVVFFAGATRVGMAPFPGPYNFSWISGPPFGPVQLKAVAWDHHGASSQSNIVTITVADPNALPYGIVNSSNTCVASTFCVMIAANDTVHNVIGYDIVMHYNASKVTPTGVITVNGALVNPNYVDVISSVDVPNSNINISLYFNGSAPASTHFQGLGNLCCVEFSKTGNFANVDTANFSIVSLQESRVTGVSLTSADAGRYSTFRDTTFGGSLRFWLNNAPLAYDPINPSLHLITNIYGNNAACGGQSATAVQPDVNGDFTYNTANGPRIAITRDIASGTSVQPVINGFDAFLTRRVLINDAGFLPSVYQIIAMDVNLDGVVSAGDLSQINQRTVLILPEYKQIWNYDVIGNHIPGTGNSKDWLFVDNARLNSTPPTPYQISSTYPLNDGIGYSKYQLPQVPFCLALPTSSADTTGNCQILVSEVYKGILLGDVNGNFATAVPNNLFRENGFDKVVFDVTNAIAGNGYVDVPVFVHFGSEVNALDFAMKFNESKLSPNSVIDNTGNLQSLANYNTSDKTFRFTSYSLQSIETGKAVVYVRFNTTGTIAAADLNSLEAYVNGERVGVDLGTNADNMVTLFPNPATEMLNVVVSQDANVQLLDVSGSEVVANTLVYANQKHQINTANLSSGVYMLRVSNGNFVTIKKVVIQK